MSEKVTLSLGFHPIPLFEWEETKETLHLFLQIVGKVRLKLMPRKNHWWHTALFVYARGITTGPVPNEQNSLEIQFDFISHELVISSSSGGTNRFSLQPGLTVAQFYSQLLDGLKDLGCEIKILAKPYDVKSKLPFAEDQEHKHYNPDKVRKSWEVLNRIDQVFKKFSGRFYGKTCPVQLYWHHFDLTVTRFSGKKVPVNPEASIVEKDAYSHEVISFGFWFGDEVVREPAFYSYTFPLPAGMQQQKLQPASAKWVDSNGSPMAFLSYAELLKEPDPEKALLAFLESAYQAGAKLANWPIKELTVPPLEAL